MYGISLFFSEEWKINNGVRQGGVLSGLLFNVYINSLIEKISSLKQGCKIGIHSSNIIAYADDIVLLAPSKKALQMLLEEAVKESHDMDLEFNSNKSKYMVFRYQASKKSCNCSLEIGNSVLEQVNSFKYLGFILTYN